MGPRVLVLVLMAMLFSACASSGARPDAAGPSVAQAETQRVRVANQTPCDMRVRVKQGAQLLTTLRVGSLTTEQFKLHPEPGRPSLDFVIEPAMCETTSYPLGSVTIDTALTVDLVLRPQQKLSTLRMSPGVL